jgi:hypothetical protein
MEKLANYLKEIPDGIILTKNGFEVVESPILIVNKPQLIKKFKETEEQPPLYPTGIQINDETVEQRSYAEEHEILMPTSELNEIIKRTPAEGETTENDDEILIPLNQF